MSNITRQFLRSCVDNKNKIISIQQFIIEFRQLLPFKIFDLSRKQKKKLFGTIRNPSNEMKWRLFDTFMEYRGF